MKLELGGGARRFLWSSAVASGVAFVLIACGATKDRGELMLAMQTDLSLPKDVDHVRIQVTSYGKSLFDQDYAVGPGATKIPATLALVGDPASPSAPVEIKVTAENETKASGAAALHVLRDVTTTVPSDRVALLRMPLAWLCWNQVNADSSGEPQSTCGAGQTCIAGSCASNGVNSDDLKTFDPSSVFGGSSDATAGACFETITCFAQGVLVTPDKSDCSIPMPANAGQGVNVALLRANSSGVGDPGGIGVCTANECYVPLDQDPTEGWSQSGDKIMLPSAVCRLLKDATPPPAANVAILGVEVTTACPTKTPANPTCGAWSSVGSAADNGEDGGTPQGTGPADYVGTWTVDEGAGNLEGCDGEPFSTTLTINEDVNGAFTIDESVGPVATIDGSCQVVTQTGMPAALQADGSLTYSPSLGSFCACTSSTLAVTLSIAADGTLTSSEAFSDINQCPSTGSAARDGGLAAPDATVSDASTPLADSGDGTGSSGGGSGGSSGGSSGSSSGGSSSGGSDGADFCSTCGGVSCTVVVTLTREGSTNGGDGGSKASDASIGNDATTPAPDSGSPESCQATCLGCCDDTNVCQSGINDVSCGEDGVQCQNCASLGGTCGGGGCVGGGADSGPGQTKDASPDGN